MPGRFHTLNGLRAGSFCLIAFQKLAAKFKAIGSVINCVLQKTQDLVHT